MEIYCVCEYNQARTSFFPRDFMEPWIILHSTHITFYFMNGWSDAIVVVMLLSLFSDCQVQAPSWQPSVRLFVCSTVLVHEFCCKFQSALSNSKILSVLSLIVLHPIQKNTKTLFNINVTLMICKLHRRKYYLSIPSNICLILVLIVFYLNVLPTST